MSDESNGAEKLREEFLSQFEELEGQVALNQRVFEATERALGRIALEFYPQLKNWQPEQLRGLADRTSRHAMQFCVELDNLNHHGARAEGKGNNP